MAYEFQAWPSYRFHESCPEGQIFEHEAQVPEGWVDHPNKIKKGDPRKDKEPPAGRVTDAESSTVAADHTLGGNENINRGTPETADNATGDQQGSSTQGGETGQTADIGSLFQLPPVDEVDKTWVIQQLSTRKVPHNPRWRLQKLYDLLKDTVRPDAVSADG